MPRAYTQSDYAESDRDVSSGEWQALRGELVALLDKVENHYGHADLEPEQPAISGLARRVRTLRDQMNGTETSSRRQEALRTVKRAVDRFSDRDRHAFAEDGDDLSEAIAEIRSRQGVAAHRPHRADMPEIRELGALVGGMSQRLERLEAELKSERSNSGHVRDVASQVEQLTQVVELLAGAIGETGQVKRLEAQIAGLAVLIEDNAKVDLHAINARLDDVSGTVSKLAELQAQQMEREVVREKNRSANPPADAAAALAPAMHSIEESVRNVYDRIDAIEKNVSLSSGDFEKLTGELAAFTQAMKDGSAAPNALVGRVEALTSRIEAMDAGNSDVMALKADLGSLRDAVLKGMEPRFLRLENQIEALNGRIDTSAVENQLQTLIARMDDAGSQLDGLARLYANGEDRPDLEALANLVAERTGDAISRKTPAPVAVFGPESLKSIEDRLTGLIKSAGKTPDYDVLADMIATRASEAVVKNAGPAADGGQMQEMEKRMTALLNTAGKDTAERLARLEAILSGKEQADAPRAPLTSAALEPRRLVESPAAQAPRDAFEEAMQKPRSRSEKLDTILAGLSREKPDTMPANPSEDAPLIDPGFKTVATEKASAPKPLQAAQAKAVPAPSQSSPHHFDPSLAQKPPRPVSSFGPQETDPFAETVKSATAPEPVAPATSTSTFVAAARRAQRIRQEQGEAEASNSVISRALARVRPRKEDAPAAQNVQAAEPAPVAPVPEDNPAANKRRKVREAKAEIAAASPDAAETPSFLTRHRRPLLLAATLVAVSMLTLNLVLQRTAPPAAPAPVETSEAEQPAPANPAPSNDQSSAVPPRIIDLIDTTATGSINPGEPMSFSRSAGASLTTPLPPNLVANSGRIDLAAEETETAPEITGSIQAPAETPKAFELPIEAVGPLELREAAANGNARAQFEVGAIFGEGSQLEKDFAESAKWYERAAAQGFAPAQYRLGNLYEVGSGVDKDMEQARLWYQRSAEAGNRMAMHNLAALYAGGQLGDPQFELAAEWFEQAANFGMTDSQFNLGMLYARGLGVEQSFEQSFKWFSLAALNGDKDAAQARDDIAKSLSADAVSRITGEVAAWKIAPVDLAANYAPIGTWSSRFDPGATITERDIILKVQQTLVKLGFEVGTPDGVAGPRTADAIKAFERATGMSETGKVNPRLLAVLGSQPV